MEKWRSLLKVTLKNSIKPTIIYYSIFIFITLGIGIMVNSSNTNMVGVEFSSMIYLFVIGICLFCDDFKFAQGNNISRKTYIKGSYVYMLVMSSVLAVIDLILNRIYNLFNKIPTIYDMSFKAPINMEFDKFLVSYEQINSIGVIFENYIWLVLAYFTAIMFGFFIGILFYRASVILRFVLGAVIIACTNFVSSFIFDSGLSISFSQNLIIFIGISAILGAISLALVKRTSVK